MPINPVKTIMAALALVFVTAGCEPVRVQEHVAIKYIGSEPITEPSAYDCWQWLWVELPYTKKSGKPVILRVGANSEPDDWVSPNIEDGNKITIFTIPGEIDKINLSVTIQGGRDGGIAGLYPPHGKLTDKSGNQIGITPFAKVPGTNVYETQIKDIPIEGVRLELPTFAFQIGQKNYRWKPSGYLLLTPTEYSIKICA